VIAKADLIADTAARLRLQLLGDTVGHGSRGQTIQQDRLLMQYDTIIIDEAHERSLNIDFLLGYLKASRIPSVISLTMVLSLT
jgi:hypothetical protein